MICVKQQIDSKTNKESNKEQKKTKDKGTKKEFNNYVKQKQEDNKGKEIKKERKKPGRPRIKPLKKPMERKGIAETPNDATNNMEWVYDMPTKLKRIFSLLKSYDAKKINLVFNKENTILKAKDHYEKSHIKVIFHGKKINHYHCSDPTSINLNSKTMDKVMQVLDGNYTSVEFLLKKVNARGMLTVVYKSEMKIDEIRDVNMTQTSSSPEVVSFDCTTYPIHFVLPSRYFKKLVSDAGLFSSTLTIGKIGNSPLTFTHTNKDKTVKCRSIVKSPDIIKLKSTISDDDIFSSSVHIDYIKPLSNSLLGDHVHVFADSNKNMIFRVLIDNGAVEVLVNTKTVQHKKIA